MSTNITVIIPVHELQTNTLEYLNKAITSISNQKTKPEEVLIVTANDTTLTEALTTFDYGTIKDITRIVTNTTDNTSFQSQINVGVENTNTEFFTFLEVDDELSTIWLDTVTKYITAYPEVGVYLPIVFESDNTGKFLSFTNELAWWQGFTEERGVFDYNRLTSFQNLNFDGMVVRKSDFTEFGGLKTNIKLTFTYEFLLRMAYNSVKVMVVPKLGYKHTNNREGSLFETYKNTIKALESRFWLDTAKKEHFFKQDRKITYEVA